MGNQGVGQPKTVVVIGASSGIGKAFVAALLAHSVQAGHHIQIHATYRRSFPEQAFLDSVFQAVHWHPLDVTDPEAVGHFCNQLGTVDWFFNFVGHLHGDGSLPEKSLRDFNKERFINSLSLNTVPCLEFAKLLGPKITASHDGIFMCVSARVGSIEDNRLGGWYSYRISKAALNMAIKNIALEWARVNQELKVFAYHPGTVDTPLSQPFQKNVPKQKLFSTQYAAEKLLDICRKKSSYESGSFIAWDGKLIPW